MEGLFIVNGVTVGCDKIDTEIVGKLVDLTCGDVPVVSVGMLVGTRVDFTIDIDGNLEVGLLLLLAS
jgi:hypothetical protein